MQDAAYWYGVIIGALLSGSIVGAIPAITGGVKGKLKLGLFGFAACVVGSLILGLLLAVPLCAIFMFFILKKSPEQKKNQMEFYNAPQNAALQNSNDVMSQLQKLGELKDSGVLTEYEFQQKKEQLLSKLQ